MLSFGTIVFMIVVLGFVWGGLLYLLNRAYKKEKGV